MAFRGLLGVPGPAASDRLRHRRALRHMIVHYITICHQRQWERTHDVTALSWVGRFKVRISIAPRVSTVIVFGCVMGALPLSLVAYSNIVYYHVTQCSP